MKYKRAKTNRGFAQIEFKDHYGAKCSLQKSSLATDDAIWLGVHDAEPKIMAADAAKLGIHTSQTTGWMDYVLPKEVFTNTRMHLTREQVAKLLPVLQKFVDTGDI